MVYKEIYTISFHHKNGETEAKEEKRIYKTKKEYKREQGEWSHIREEEIPQRVMNTEPRNPETTINYLRQRHNEKHKMFPTLIKKWEKEWEKPLRRYIKWHTTKEIRGELKCYYCGESEYGCTSKKWINPPGKRFIQIGHKTAIFNGGTSHPKNISPQCIYCNYFLKARTKKEIKRIMKRMTQ